MQQQHSSQLGSAPIIIAIVLALGLSTALIVANEKTLHVAQSARIDAGRTSETEANISATAYIKAATQYRKVSSFVEPSGAVDPGPDPTDPAALPALFPDPYYANVSSTTPQAGPLVPVIAKPTGALWSYNALAGDLSVAFPGADKMRGSDFQQLVQQGSVPSGAAALNTAVKAAGIMVSSSAHPWLVAGLQLSLTTQSTGANWAHQSTAQIDLPRPAHPRCTLVAPSAPVGPNQVVPIQVMIAGVASRIYFPAPQLNQAAAAQISPFYTDKTLIPAYHSGNNYLYQDLRGVTNSVRNTAPILATTFNVTTPRILAVVDGSNATVPIWLTAYVVAPDDTEHECVPAMLQEENVADCRLALDNYTLQAPAANAPAPTAPTQSCTNPSQGQKKAATLACTTTSTAAVAQATSANPYGLAACADISYSLLGVFDPSTFKLRALDPAGTDVSAKTLAFGGKAFCPPTGAIGRYRLLGSVSGKNNNGTPSQCMAQVDVSTLGLTPNTSAGVPTTASGKPTSTNSSNSTPVQNCPLFFGGTGSKVQPTCQSISGAVDYFGDKSVWTDGKFCPQLGFDGNKWMGFEVDAIAISPLQVAPCPQGARCFGLGSSGSTGARNLFVVVNNADGKLCAAVGQSRTNLGCFDGATQIRLADGSSRAIAKIKAGDRVWNPAQRAAATVSFVSVGVEAQALVRLELEHGESLRLTATHPVPTPRGILMAGQVRVGDHLQNGKGDWLRVTAAAVEAHSYNDLVYNLKLAPQSAEDSDHMLEANGLVTGDLYLQERLQAKALATPSQIARRP